MKQSPSHIAALVLGLGILALILPALPGHSVGAKDIQIVRDVNNPDLQPFMTECVVNTFNAAGRGSCALDAVPAGKRFVIETISGQFQISTGTRPVTINLQVCAAGRSSDNFFSAVPQGDSDFFTGDFFALTQQVRLYADSNCGWAPFFNVTINRGTTGDATFVASGHLIDLP